MTILQTNEIVALGGMVQGHAADAARSLDLLRNIQTTCLCVGSIAHTFRGIAQAMSKLHEGLESVESVIPENDVLPPLNEAQDSLQRMEADLRLRLESARADARLTPDDGVEDVYSDAIAAVADTFNAIEDVRWGIMNHNAIIDGARGPTFKTAEEVDAFFEAL